ncbi:hypothetical protein ID875_15980 [Streptomyces globisporus]|uniref:Uncharacterized protein n=1 Tax=Streptomyces globisporus TaxID=1908 RepID=A0A927BMM3_STRGL|nr:hypothetical protein [Streptomyces globisporus]
MTATTATTIPSGIRPPCERSRVQATGSAMIWVISAGPRLQLRSSSSPRAPISGIAPRATRVMPTVSACCVLSSFPSSPAISR